MTRYLWAYLWARTHGVGRSTARVYALYIRWNRFTPNRGSYYLWQAEESGRLARVFLSPLP